MIRDALIEDSGHIAEIIVSAWQTAYEGVIDPGFPATLSVEKFTEIFRDNIGDSKEIIRIHNSGDGEITGFISGVIKNEGRHDSEIIGLYVSPSSQGKGIGRGLLLHMLSFFKDSGCRSTMLRTLKGVKNNSFYEKLGGIAAEEISLEFGGKDYRGTVYTWEL
ncbi:MAG TPA: GNAT family N-acetyltransferase [Spirochaetota bacterium]|nr:GNAT family N-acetyltransferase [Spirochaetota bacterium]HPJ35654.1 GNAT family N-acetyltransferase [Spirochaetota bacterium]